MHAVLVLKFVCIYRWLYARAQAVRANKLVRRFQRDHSTCWSSGPFAKLIGKLRLIRRLEQVVGHMGGFRIDLKASGYKTTASGNWATAMGGTLVAYVSCRDARRLASIRPGT